MALISLKVIGLGKPLVLLHAFPLSNLIWENFEPPKDFALILPDFPGFGSSPLAKEGFSLAEAAQELLKSLEEEGIRQPIVLGGISMGGYWAMEFIRQFPEKMSKIIFVSTRAGLDKPDAKQRRLEMAERVLRDGPEFLTQTMVPGLLGKTTLDKKPVIVEKLKNWIRQTSPQGIALAQRAMAQRQDKTDLLAKIGVKTLILAGNEDNLISFSEAEVMAGLIPNSQLEIFKNVGHLVPLEEPDQFQKITQSFSRPLVWG